MAAGTGAAIAAWVVAAAAVAGGTYAIVSGEQAKSDRHKAMDEQEELNKKTLAATEAEARRREEELKLQKDRLAAETAERQRLIDERKSLLAGVATVRNARRSLLSTEGSVWETRANVRVQSLGGTSAGPGKKTLLGE